MNRRTWGFEWTASDCRRVQLSGLLIAGLLALVMPLPIMVGATNTQPHDLEFTCESANPNPGELVYLNASAIDDEQDQLRYWWRFYDNGDVEEGPRVTHQFMQAGAFYVMLCVDDGVLGEDPTPSMLAKVISVGENSPPSVSLPNYPNVPLREVYSFKSDCTDLDQNDSIRLTWIWGDGTLSVTNHQSTGGTFTATTQHTYIFRGDYNVTVWIDDLTNLPGHNVSDYGFVHIGFWNHAPIIQSFDVDNPAPFAGEEVTFHGLVTDLDSDLCDLNFTFGDGTWLTVYQFLPNTSLSVTHVYSTPSVYLAYLDATDGVYPAYTADPILIEVSPPEFTLSLVAGWNLISVPLVNQGYWASTLGLPTSSIVVGGWNSTTQNWDKVYVVGVSPPFKDFAIEEGKGFWVMTPASGTLHLYGDIPTGLQSMTINISGSGWALIGLNSLKTWHASDIPAMYSGGNVRLVVIYDAPFHVYKSFIVELPFTDFSIPPGCGIWIFVDGGGTLSYYA